MRGFEISKYQVISNVFVAFVSFILFFLPAVSIIFDIRFLIIYRRILIFCIGQILFEFPRERNRRKLFSVSSCFVNRKGSFNIF